LKCVQLLADRQGGQQSNLLEEMPPEDQYQECKWKTRNSLPGTSGIRFSVM
jgi:hypothetical protein